MMVIDEIDLIRIKEGDMDPLKTIFNKNYSYCVKNLVRIVGCSETDAKDYVMDAIIVLKEKIVSNDYSNKNVRSFLLTVSRNKWRNQSKRDSRIYEYDPRVLEEILSGRRDQHKTEFYQSQLELILNSIQGLNEPCRTILELNLVKGFALEVVFRKLGYKSKAVLKTTKTRCMKKLRSAIFKS